MAESKKYYWLKLPKDFFEDRAIKKLRSIAGGDTYTIIYLKMLLRTLEDDGKFVYEGIEDSIVEEIALDIDEKEEDVSVAISYLIKKGLMICTENEAELTRMHEMIGSETDKAKLMRKIRSLKNESNKVTENSNNVTNLLPDVTKCYTDIEKEIDKELDTNTDTNIDTEINNTCSELKKSPSEPVLISIPLNDGTYRNVVQSEINNWQQLYPAVDIMQQLRNMVGWSESNPKKRKTKLGINRFINSWLSRAQDKGQYQQTPKPRQANNNDWSF